METKCAEADPVKCECNCAEDTSSVTTEDVVEALTPSWPLIRVEINLPGWFIIVAAMIVGLRNTCPV
jgi:hypothetical protein